MLLEQTQGTGKGAYVYAPTCLAWVVRLKPNHADLVGHAVLG